MVKRVAKTNIRSQLTFRSSSNFTSIALPLSSPSADLSTLSTNVTVVTAYFNLGSFIKGDVDLFRPELYRRWMTVFSRINNPVVAYFDTDNDAAYFEIVRSKLPAHLTKIVKVSRGELWSFHLVPYINELYRQSWYPKHSPNTINADYSAAMHAKYELIRRMIIENEFRTQFVCWLDVGLFRDLVPALVTPSLPSGPPFLLSLPRGFDPETIAYSEVNPRKVELNAEEIVFRNLVWVCGCFFLGRVDVLFRWTLEYMEGVEKMLEGRWMSTDQQVIYWIYNKNLHKTQIQTYADGTSPFNSWFYLGYLAKVTGEHNSSSQYSTMENL